MHYILHIDTATDIGTIALAGDGTILATRTNDNARNHAGTINILINEVLAETGISLPDISAVAACAGPGSYTGLRIGVATAKGLCYALDKPLILHNRLTLMAYGAYANKEIKAPQYVSLLVARDQEYFIAVYDNNFNCTVQPQHIMYQHLPEIIDKKADTFFITDVSEQMVRSLNINNIQMNLSVSISLDPWGAYAWIDYKCNNIVNLSAAEPFYLKQVYTHK